MCDHRRAPTAHLFDDLIGDTGCLRCLECRAILSVPRKPPRPRRLQPANKVGPAASAECGAKVAERDAGKSAARPNQLNDFRYRGSEQHGVAKPEPSAQLAPSTPKFGLRNLRLAIWGVSAATAMFIAFYAATTEIGRNRLFGRSLEAQESRRLAETVLRLAADQDRLLARIGMLERSLDGMSGLKARVEQVEQTVRTFSIIPAVSRFHRAPVDIAPSESAPGEESSSGATAAASAPPAPNAALVDISPSESEPDEESSSGATTAASAPPALHGAPVDTTQETAPIGSEPNEHQTVSLPMPPRPPPASFTKRFGLKLGRPTTVEALRVKSPRGRDRRGGEPRFKQCETAVESVDLPRSAFRLAASFLQGRTGSRCPSNAVGAQISPAAVILTHRQDAGAALGTGSARRAMTRAARPGRHGATALHHQRGVGESEMARRGVAQQPAE
jgi:hypothetical protein